MSVHFMDSLTLLKDFLSDRKNNAFIITGGAGTGKTTSIRNLIDYLNDEERPYYLLAPTGRAAQNLYNHVEDISNIPAQTIHSFLYSVSQDEETAAEIIKFDIKDLNIEDDAVIIIDEASMLSHLKIGETDYLQFGSGNLLDDLLAYIELNNSNRKLVLIGDTCQLPPFNANIAEVLNPKFIESLGLKVEYLHLLQIYRQASSSNLLNNIKALRDKIESNDFLTLPVVADNSEIFTTSLEEAIQKYIWMAKNSMFIAFTNQQVQAINLKFRELCDLSATQLEKKEVLLLVKNSLIQGKRYYNGDMFIVESTGNEESFSYPVKDLEKNDVQVELKFLDVELTHKASGQYISTKILNSKLWSENPQPTREELVALIVNFRQRHSQLKTGSPEYRQAIRSDPYFNALFMRFGYALTCHKAQGGEWENIFIDLNRTNNDLKTKSGFTWLYTALTRARKMAFLVDLPVAREFNPNEPFQHFTVSVQETLLNNSFKLIEQRALEYELQLFIKKDNIVSGFKFYRTNKMKISKLMPMKVTAHTAEIESLLTHFVNISLTELSL